MLKILSKQNLFGTFANYRKRNGVRTSETILMLNTHTPIMCYST